jgi:hypothetical protein
MSKVIIGKAGGKKRRRRCMVIGCRRRSDKSVYIQARLLLISGCGGYDGGSYSIEGKIPLCPWHRFAEGAREPKR